MKRPEYVPEKTGFKVPDVRLRLDQTFLKKPNIKAADVEIKRTLEQEMEYVRAASDAQYFAENYYKITSIDKGFTLFKMYEYQRELFKAFQENRFNISLQARQSGKTTVVAAFILWFAMFHPDKECFLLANKEKQAKEILSRISKAYLDVPFFLQRGCRKFGSTEIEFDNGSKIVAYATSPDSIRGRSCVTGDTKVTVRSKITGEIKTVDISELYREPWEGNPTFYI